MSTAATTANTVDATSAGAAVPIMRTELRPPTINLSPAIARAPKSISSTLSRT